MISVIRRTGYVFTYTNKQADSSKARADHKKQNEKSRTKIPEGLQPRPNGFAQSYVRSDPQTNGRSHINSILIAAHQGELFRSALEDSMGRLVFPASADAHDMLLSHLVVLSAKVVKND